MSQLQADFFFSLPIISTYMCTCMALGTSHFHALLVDIILLASILNAHGTTLTSLACGLNVSCHQDIIHTYMRIWLYGFSRVACMLNDVGLSVCIEFPWCRHQRERVWRLSGMLHHSRHQRDDQQRWRTAQHGDPHTFRRGPRATIDPCQLL